MSEQKEWQPIETAPKDGTVFHAWFGDASGADAYDLDFYCIPGTRFSSAWHWRQGKFRPVIGMHLAVVSVQPTHWMPLPGPPQVVEG